MAKVVVYILHILQKLCAHTAHAHNCKSCVHVLQYSLWQKMLRAHTIYTLYGKSRAQNAHSPYFKSYVHIPHMLVIAKVVYIMQYYVHTLHIIFIAQVTCTYRNTHCCKSYAYIPHIPIVAIL